MREIKFRAWSKGEMWHNFWVDSKDGAIQLFNDEDVLVDSSDVILMQFTGLKDKNGVEIYEGDIIHRNFRKVPNSPNWLVLWDEKKGRWIWKREESAFHGWSLTITSAKEYEVIGNIWENPELLT